MLKVVNMYTVIVKAVTKTEGVFTLEFDIGAVSEEEAKHYARGYARMTVKNAHRTVCYIA